jgi:ferrous iron transport protein A
MQPTISLSQLKPGQRATVEAFQKRDAQALRLQELGLLPGTPVEMVRYAPLGDPLEIRLRGFCLSLRKKEASGVSVRVA